MRSFANGFVFVGLMSLTFASPLAGQIIVNKADFAPVFAPGSSVSFYSDTSKSVNVGTKGGPTVYDFSMLAFPDTSTYPIYLSSSIPFLAARFDPSSMVWGSSPQSIDGPVIELNDSAFETVGNVTIDDTVQVVRYSNPYEETLRFPAAYDETWSTSPAGAGVESTFVNNRLDTVSSGWNSAQTYAIDGYGTLVLPGGSHACLRVKSFEPDDFTYMGFWYITKDGLTLQVSSRKSERDTGTIAVEQVSIIRGASVTEVPPAVVASQFSLGQNFPNPFNPVTVINYQLPRNSDVSLEVYDILGRQVRTLARGMQSAGSHSVTFDAGALSSGVYFYRLTAGPWVETKKLVLMR